MTPRLARFRAFTLIELLIVIAIISFLAATLVVLAMNMKKKAMIQETNARLGILQQALTDYHATFLAFPPTTWSAPLCDNNDAPGSEWWRWLTFTGGTQYLRPQKADGSIVEEAFCKEQDLKLKATSGARFPRDAWETNIRYVFPVDNDVADLTPSSAGVLMPVAPMTAALTYYHCVLISAGPDKKIGTVAPGTFTNLNAYEANADNADNVRKGVSGQ